MADERDLELLDDYLTNRMDEQDRLAFEQKLQADPDLRNEYAMQSRLLKGIRDARVAELKAMLNQVPVGAHGMGHTAVTKIIVGTLVTLVIAAATYWYISREDIKTPETGIPAEQHPAPEEEAVTPESSQEAPASQQERVAEEPGKVEPDKNQTSAGTEHSKPSLARKPDPLNAPGKADADTPTEREPVLDVFDPAAEDSTPGADAEREKQPAFNTEKSTLLVETDRDNSRYKFHYQFREGKLFLFGPFEENLYEILEFFAGDKRTVFLYYRDHYYRLEEADGTIRPLEAITDAALLKKLKEYRSAK